MYRNIKIYQYTIFFKSIISHDNSLWKKYILSLGFIYKFKHDSGNLYCNQSDFSLSKNLWQSQMIFKNNQKKSDMLQKILTLCHGVFQFIFNLNFLLKCECWAINYISERINPWFEIILTRNNQQSCKKTNFFLLLSSIKLNLHQIYLKENFLKFNFFLNTTCLFDFWWW